MLENVETFQFEKSGDVSQVKGVTGGLHSGSARVTHLTTKETVCISAHKGWVIMMGKVTEHVFYVRIIEKS